MTKHALLITIIFCFITAKSADANPNLFSNIFTKQTDDREKNAITAAERMHARLTGETPLFDFDFNQEVDNIKNPFRSKIPLEEAVNDDPNAGGFPLPHDGGIKPTKTATGGIKPTFNISGLIWNTNNPQAIIDNNIVTIGHNIQGWTIVNISKDGILLESKDKTRYLIEPQRSAQ
jgi:hypothetical protein